MEHSGGTPKLGAWRINKDPLQGKQGFKKHQMISLFKGIRQEKGTKNFHSIGYTVEPSGENMGRKTWMPPKTNSKAKMNTGQWGCQGTRHALVVYYTWQQCHVFSICRNYVIGLQDRSVFWQKDTLKKHFLLLKLLFSPNTFVHQLNYYRSH